MDLMELYQQLILDHGRHPRNFGALTDYNLTQEGFNPLCGDQYRIYVLEKKGVIENIGFDGSGCAISMASASLMTESLRGQCVDTFEKMFHAFSATVKGEPVSDYDLGKLEVLSGVAQYPMRVKCATLCWHTLNAALTDSHSCDSVSTE